MSDVRNQHGAFSWGELITPDPAAAAKFYESVFGWKSEAMKMPDGGDYHVFVNAEGTKVGGAMKPPPTMPPETPAHWKHYVTVKDVDAAVAAIESSGGTVIVPAFDVPEVGRMAHFQDPTGAHLAVIKYVNPM